MTAYRSILLVSAVLSLCQLTWASETNPAATSTADVDYGEMYVIQKHELSPKQWQAGLAYTYGFSNPYLGIHGAQLDLSRHLNEYISLGVSPGYFKTTKKSIAADLANKLDAQGITTNVFEPKYSGHLVLSVTPLSGMLNWFSSSAVDFDFVFSVAAGLVKYNEEAGLLPSFRLSATPQVMLTRAFGVAGGVQTTLERFSDKEWQNRFDTIVSVVGRF